MPLFGGDPRLLPIELILQINKLYDILCLPLMLINQLNNMGDMNSTIVGFILMIFELVRILLVGSHQKSNIPNFVGFLILSFIPPLVMEFVYLLAIKNTSPFIKSILIGFIILDILEIAVGVIAYLRLSKYLNDFFQFAKVKMNNQIYEPIDEKVDDDE